MIFKLKQLVFLILICSSFTAFSQNRVTKILYYDQDWIKVTSKNDAIFSRIITFKTSDLERTVGVVKDFYLKSGALQWEGKFSFYDINKEDNNRIDGKAIWYYENGKKSRESYFDDGKQIGKTTYWYDNGYKSAVYNFNNYGELHGVYESYDKRGRLISSGEYKRNKLDGYFQRYHKNGGVKWQRYFENGVPNKWITECDEYGKCDWVVQDYFNSHENYNEWSLGYNSDQSCYYNLDTALENYSITTYKNGYVYRSTINVGINPVSEYVIETKLKQERGGKDNHYGIFFGLKDWDNYMVLDIHEGDDNTYYRIHEKRDGVNYHPVRDWKKLTGVNYYKGSYNKFQIRQFYDSEEDKIKLLFVINGDPLGTSPSSLLKGFNFGFKVDDGNAKVTMDYIKLKYPSDKDNIFTRKSPCPGGYGTGFAIGSNGFIATNYHVVNECKNVFVRNVQGDTIPAKVVLRDSVNDLAILKINKWLGEIPYSFLNNDLDVLERVYAYGFPKILYTGLQIKATEGEITAQSATRKDDRRYYQHTAPIQKGNSGGPLFDLNGNMIGVNTLKWHTLENVGAAVKAKYLTKLMEQQNIPLPRGSSLYNKKPSQQYKIIKDFVYLVRSFDSENQ